MKRSLSVMAVALVLGMVATASGQGLSPYVSNTPHNLNNGTVAVDRNQVCLPCHVPHNAYPYDPYVDPYQKRVLWNHQESIETNWTMYTTLDGHTGVGPQGPSKMCLSCHDGVTAIDNYGGRTDGTIFMSDPTRQDKLIGTDLSDDHPIGIEYPDYLVEPDFNDPNTFQGVKLVNIDGTDRVECTSCHDPHNNQLGSFLRRELNESRICLECHNK